MDNQSGPDGAAPDPRPRGAGTGLARWLRTRPAWLKTVLALVLVIALGATAYAFSQAGRGNSPAPSASNGPATAGNPTSAPPTATPTPTPEPPTVDMNILLLGSDSRGDARAAEAQAAAGTPADQRSDMIMLVHIPADRQKIYGVSIPRDLWVDIPGYGQSKINAALGIGGMPLVAKTVEGLFNTHIDHTALMDFEGFKATTDALGGVDVNVTFPFTSTHDSKHNFPAGVNHLNGAEALEFVRERYAFSDGDFQRIRNQQTFLKAVIGKFMSASTLTSPATGRNVVNAVRPYLIVDQGLDADTLVHLAFSLRNVKPQDAVLFRVPTAGFGTSADGQSIVVEDPAAITALATALAEGKLTDYVAANGFENGN